MGITCRVFMCRIDAVIYSGPQNKARLKSTAIDARSFQKGTVVDGLKPTRCYYIWVILFNEINMWRKKIDKILYPF